MQYNALETAESCNLMHSERTVAEAEKVTKKETKNKQTGAELIRTGYRSVEQK